MVYKGTKLHIDSMFNYTENLFMTIIVLRFANDIDCSYTFAFKLVLERIMESLFYLNINFGSLNDCLGQHFYPILKRYDSWMIIFRHKTYLYLSYLCHDHTKCNYYWLLVNENMNVPWIMILLMTGIFTFFHC